MTKPVNQKIVLTFLAQEYGLTVDDIVARFKCKPEDVIVEPAPPCIAPAPLPEVKQEDV